jgi:BirA family biotin operon repressor/biotin-[acetyl-CoA-carboxylase] ligase
VGLAAAEALQICCQLHCVIKWPNDLLVNEKKIAGVLCQCELDGDQSIIIAGVGINANFPARRLGRDLRQPATSISDALGKLVDLQTLRELLVDNIRKNLELMETGGFAATILPRIQLRLAWQNQAVVYGGDGSEPKVEGILTHVDEAGRAVIVTGSGRQAVSCGELRRPRMAGRVRLTK